jgi:hypothetical protein
MAGLYRLTLSPNVVIRNADETLVFLSDAENANAVSYSGWLAAGGVPDPFVSLPVQQSVLSQDIMGQFTAEDATKIQAAIAGNVQFWLLWSAMQAQKDPMIVTNDRFLQGWSALVTVLGSTRMAAIAAALGITIAS